MNGLKSGPEEVDQRWSGGKKPGEYRTSGKEQAELGWPEIEVFEYPEMPSADGSPVLGEHFAEIAAVPGQKIEAEDGRPRAQGHEHPGSQEHIESNGAGGSHAGSGPESVLLEKEFASRMA